MKKISAIVLLLCLALTVFSGCSQPPELDEVKDELVELLTLANAVDDLLFGKGPVTEYEQSGVYTEYTDEVKRLESYYADSEDNFTMFYSPVLATVTDDKGNEVKQVSSIAEIKKLAERVYTTNFLSKVYRNIFEKTVVAVGSNSAVVRPRYREYTDPETGASTLYKYNFLSENDMEFIESVGGHAKYDVGTMKIVKPSDADTLIIEIVANYLDYEFVTAADDEYAVEKRPKGYSDHTKKIYFEKENGKWRLDAAIY